MKQSFLSDTQTKKKLVNLFMSVSKINKTVAVIVAATIGLIGYYLMSTYANSSSFVLVGTHPQAVNQSTVRGKTIASLYSWNGKIYAGYGDYGANTGPIAINPYNPTANAFEGSKLSFDTEEVTLFREIKNSLYGVATDRKTNADYAVGSVTSGTETWANRAPVASTHVFDVISLTGSDLWLVGSKGSDAVAWRSLDNGSTWQESLRVPKNSTTSGDFARFYFAGVFNGKLYVQASDYYGYSHPSSKIFDGTSWSNGPNLNAYAGFHAEAFAGKMVYQTGFSSHSASNLMAFNGVTASSAANFTVYSYTISGTTAYALASDGKVYTSTNASTWTHSYTAPLTARSIAVQNGAIYVGTSDSKLYRYGTDQQSPDPEPDPEPNPTTVGDINGDTKVDVFDLSILLSRWNTSDIAADVNKDGTVNVFDLSILLSNWKS